MQFVVIGYDGTDENALNRRLKVRNEHIKLGDKLKEEGKMLYGAAIIDESNKMIGSILIVDFDSRHELNKWLEIEPYVTEKVWEKIEIKQCKVGPSFVE